MKFVSWGGPSQPVLQFEMIQGKGILTWWESQMKGVVGLNMCSYINC